VRERERESVEGQDNVFLVAMKGAAAAGRKCQQHQAEDRVLDRGEVRNESDQCW
jgi:hypothetical protein